jgi:Cu-processing system permease protein
MMTSLSALALNGFREARRNRVTVLVGAFALLLILSTRLVTEITVTTFDRVITDFGLGVMSILMVFLAIYLSAGGLSRDIERRTIFLLMSKPISRTTFVLGRLAGNMVTLAILVAAMTGLFVLQLVLHRSPIIAAHFIAIWGLYLELLVLSTLGLLLSSFATPLVSALVSAGLYFVGHLSGDLYRLGNITESPVLSVVAKATYYLAPNLERFNFRPQAAYAQTIPLSEVAMSTGIALGWATLFLVVTSIIFERRDFK